MIESAGMGASSVEHAYEQEQGGVGMDHILRDDMLGMFYALAPPFGEDGPTDTNTSN